MKKRVALFLVLLFFLCITITSGAEDSTTETKSPVQGKNIVSSVNNGAEKVIEKEVNIPNNLDWLARIIFGIKNNQIITIEGFVVLISIWLIFVLIIKDLLKISPFLNGSTESFFGSIIITTIIAVTGVINSLSIMAFNFGSSIGWIEKLGALRIVILPLISTGVIWVVEFFLGSFRHKLKLEEAKQEGASIARLTALAKRREKVDGELRN